jgi:hypothetical protein
MRTANILPDVPGIDPARIYTIDEGAHVSRLCHKTLRKGIKAQRLRVLPAGGRKRLILGADLLKWLRGESTNGAAS